VTVSKVMSAYMNHGKTTSAKRNSGQKSTLTEKRLSYIEDCFQKSRNYCSTVDRTEYSSWRQFPEKLYDATWAAIAKPLITESNAQMRKQWCHNHKTWTSDNWKHIVLHAVPCIKKSLHLENTQGRLQSRMPGSNSKTQGRFCDGLGCNIMVFCLVPFLPFMAKLLQGSTW
jgi:hypothetical protein